MKTEDIRSLVESTATRYGHIDLENRLKALVIRRCRTFIRGPRVLTMGYAMDDWPNAALAEGATTVDIIEGVERFAAHGRQRYGANDRVTVFHALFEEFAPKHRYDTIIFGSVIEHLIDVPGMLKRIAGWLAEGGQLLVTTPNVRSMHRRVGALMNIDSPAKLNQQAVHTDVLRGYDKYTLRDELVGAGYKVSYLNGCFLKPLSTGQMADWSDELLEAFLHLGDELGDYGKELVAVCTL